MHWITFKDALENFYNCIGKILQLHWKTYKNISKNLQKSLKNRTKIEFKNSAKAALLSYCDCSRNLVKSTTIELERKQVLSAIHHDYSGSLHTICNCKICIESTVGTRTHVKPVFFTVNLFAVQSEGINAKKFTI